LPPPSQAVLESTEQTGAETLVTACPFCEMNLESSAKTMNSQIRVDDIIDLVHEAV
jgi:Fe-S oxidoreductase